MATLVANRNRPGTDALIGPLANTVILRTDLGGDPSPREVMRRVRATTLAAFTHQDLPFEELVGDSRARARRQALGSRAGHDRIAECHIAAGVEFRRNLTFEEANPSMLVPLVTTTTFDVIMMLHESDARPRGILHLPVAVASMTRLSIACCGISSRCSNRW